MRFLTRSFLGLFLLAVTVGLLTVAGLTLKSAIDIRYAESTESKPARERVFTTLIDRIEPGRLTPVMTVFGGIESRRKLELRAPAAGPIAAIAENFVNGGEVKEGQLLLRIDPADALSARDLARTDLAESETETRDAEGALVLARDDLAAAEEQANLRQQALDRQRGIGERGFGTTSAVEAAELALSNAVQGVVSRRQALAQTEARSERAVTALDRARLALADAERRLAETELFAEFSGVLSGVSAVQGGLLARNEKLGELSDPNALDVSFRVSNAQFLRLIDDSGRLLPLSVTVNLDGTGGTLKAEGKLARVDAAVAAGTAGRLIFATLDRPIGFRPGDFVTVEVAEPPLDGVAMIPAAAVGSDGTILTLGADNRLNSQTIDVLRRQGDSVILRVGALAGVEYVSERNAMLGAGILVRPIRPGEDAQSGADDGAELKSDAGQAGSGKGG
jgi:multidrug efflux pump subunit AcrA (membrane-fusion protein)